MDPLVLELRKIYARIKRLEARIVRDEPLCSLVRECGFKIRMNLTQTPMLEQ